MVRKISAAGLSQPAIMPTRLDCSYAHQDEAIATEKAGTKKGADQQASTAAKTGVANDHSGGCIEFKTGDRTDNREERL